MGARRLSAEPAKKPAEKKVTDPKMTREPVEKKAKGKAREEVIAATEVKPAGTQPKTQAERNQEIIDAAEEVESGLVAADGIVLEEVEDNGVCGYSGTGFSALDGVSRGTGFAAVGAAAAKNENLDAVAWRNPRALIIEKFECVVPLKVHNIIRTVNKVVPSDEFSVLLKGTIDYFNRKVTINPDEWMIPEQEVTSTAVDYKEDCEDFNMVMHKHPGSMGTFSGTDKDWINQNFEISILWTDDKWHDGIINLKLQGGGRVQLPVKVTTEEAFQEVEGVREAATAKIHKRTTYVATTYGAGGYGNQYGGYGGTGGYKGRGGATSRTYEKGKVWNAAKADWEWPANHPNSKKAQPSSKDSSTGYGDGWEKSRKGWTFRPEKGEQSDDDKESHSSGLQPPAPKKNVPASGNAKGSSVWNVERPESPRERQIFGPPLNGSIEDNPPGEGDVLAREDALRIVGPTLGDSEYAWSSLDEPKEPEELLDLVGIGMTEERLNELDLVVIEWNHYELPMIVIRDMDIGTVPTYDEFLEIQGIGFEDAELEAKGFEVLEWNNYGHPMKIMTKEQYDLLKAEYDSLSDPFMVAADGVVVAEVDPDDLSSEDDLLGSEHLLTPLNDDTPPPEYLCDETSPEKTDSDAWGASGLDYGEDNGVVNPSANAVDYAEEDMDLIGLGGEPKPLVIRGTKIDGVDLRVPPQNKRKTRRV